MTLPLIAGSASAADTCAKSGYAATHRDAKNVVLRRDMSKYFWEGGWAYYVCSHRYGRLTYIGDVGITADGPVWATPMAMNSRYAAVVTGYGGNADGGSDDGMELYDLKSGKRIWRGSTSPAGDSEENYVPTVALASSGAVGWINQGDGFGTEVNVRLPRQRARRIAAGADIDSDFLRWSIGKQQFVWTESPTILKHKSAEYKPARAPKSGSCFRPGDRAAGRDYEYVYVTRAIRDPSWTDGRVLIACSLKYKRRVAIARAGTHGKHTYRYESPVVTEGFAAVVLHRETGGADERQWIASYDLSRGRRTCLTAAGPLLNDPVVGAIGISWAGATFWNVAGEAQGSLYAVPKTTTLRVCANGQSKVLLTDGNLDTAFLRLDGDSVVVATEVMSGK